MPTSMMRWIKQSVNGSADLNGGRRPRFPPLLGGETPQTDKLTLACLFGVYSQSKVFLILSHKIVTLYKMCGEQN